MDPLNCNNPNVKFLLADWERLPGFGISAQIAGMCGLLAIAINERRVLVTNFYNRADHDGCKGMINYCDQYYGTVPFCGYCSINFEQLVYNVNIG